MANGFTYLIGWRSLDRWYYGYKTLGKLTAEDVLWKTYFTSSQLVQSYREKHGEPDVVRVHRVFGDVSDARKHEQRFLTKVGARESVRWINQTNGNANWYIKPGGTRSEAAKEKAANGNRGKKLYHNTDGTLKKFRPCDAPDGWTMGYPTTVSHPLTGIPLAQDVKDKMKAAWTRRAPDSEETREKKRKAHLGVKRPEHAEKMKGRTRPDQSARMKKYWAQRKAQR